MGDQSAPHAGSSPLSATRLRAAFARMLGQPSDGAPSEPSRETPRKDSCEISPRSITEAILFVGRTDNRPLSAREIAQTMRDVSPREIDDAVVELNQAYERDQSAFEIAGDSQGYQLVVRPELERLRRKLNGKTREARLSAKAIEVLALVAYHQPIKLAQIDELRGAASGAILAGLVRKKLVRLDRPPEAPRRPDYLTTDRFLKLFRLRDLADLPQIDDETSA